MSKKASGLFQNTKGDLAKQSRTSSESPRLSENCNSAGSKDVKLVKKVTKIEANRHTGIRMEGVPNSAIMVTRGEKLLKERYYDENGLVYLDIDYTNHGNPGTHPIVPHQHKWAKNKFGKLRRNEWEKINK